MIKYTILYKNGKTWNGKCKHVDDLKAQVVANDVLHITVTTQTSVHVLWPCRTWLGNVNMTQVVLDRHNGKFKLPRKPNPASVTKKQKKFDEDYARWVRDWHLRGSSDITMQAYKKWLWEQKQAKLKSVDVATSITFSGPVEVPVNITINWDGIYKPWKEAAIKKYKTHSYNEPIKTTYTFWLGQDGSISDE